MSKSSVFHCGQGLVADAQRLGTAARSRSSTKEVATTAAPGGTTTGLGALRHPTTIEIRNGATAQVSAFLDPFLFIKDWVLCFDTVDFSVYMYAISALVARVHDLLPVHTVRQTSTSCVAFRSV